MKPRQLIALVLTAIVVAHDLQAEEAKGRSGRPLLYNLIVKEADPFDQMIRDRYAAKYEIIELRKEPTYISAKLTKTRFPDPIFDKANMEIAGSVRVGFVITASGRLVDPFIVGSANPLLSKPVLEVLKEFRATPARVKGAPVAVVETLKFTFGAPPRRRLDTHQ